MKKALDLIKNSILHLSNRDNMDEAIKYFEEERHKNYLPKSKELFNEISISQLAILFKLLIDLNEVQLKNNVIKLETSHKEEK